MQELSVFVPGLLAAPGATAGTDGNDRYPALELLLARAQRDDIPARSEPASHEAATCALFGLAAAAGGDLPIAALTLLQDLAEPAPGGWARADPVHLRADLGKLRLLGWHDLQLDEITASNLCGELNRHLAGDKLQLRVGSNPSRWYLQIPDPLPRLQSQPPALALGEHIDPYLPQGPDRPAWMRLANEMQMLLHDSPTNAQRESRGLPAINSLWLWGFGRQPQMHAAPWQAVLSNDPLTHGLAQAAQVPTIMPAAAGQLAQPGLRDHTHILVVPFDTASSYRQAEQHARLDTLERDWLTPILALLQAQQLQGLILLTESRRYRLTRRGLYRFWQPIRPLRDYL